MPPPHLKQTRKTEIDMMIEEKGIRKLITKTITEKPRVKTEVLSIVIACYMQKKRRIGYTRLFKNPDIIQYSLKINIVMNRMIKEKMIKYKASMPLKML